MVRYIGLFSIIPTALLLTISFFVLVTLNKVNLKNLRAFGIAIVILLWISAALLLSVGIYTVITGQHPIMHMMQKQMMMKNMIMPPGGMMPPGGIMPKAK